MPGTSSKNPSAVSSAGFETDWHSLLVVSNLMASRSPISSPSPSSLLKKCWKKWGHTYFLVDHPPFCYVPNLPKDRPLIISDIYHNSSTAYNGETTGRTYSTTIMFGFTTLVGPENWQWRPSERLRNRTRHGESWASRKAGQFASRDRCPSYKWVWPLFSLERTW